MASDLQSRLAEQIARLDSAPPDRRRIIYDEARATLNADIRAGAPFVSVQEAVKRRRELETAIIAVERDAARKDPPPTPKKIERPPEPEPEKEPEPAVAVAAEAIAPEAPVVELPPPTPGQPIAEPAAPTILSSEESTPHPEPEWRLDVEDASSSKPPANDAASREPPDAIVEQFDLDFSEVQEDVPQRSALRSFTLYGAVVLLVVGVVAAALVIAGIGIDEVRVTDATPKQQPQPELRLRTGPVGLSPSNPAADLFRTAGFTTAAASSLKQGMTLLERGDVDRAISAFDDAIRLDPREPAAYGNRAFAYWRKGAIDRAIADYSEAIALDPAHPGSRLNRAIAYNRIGEYQRAIADLDRVLVVSPANTEALNSRCWARAILKHLEEALADCNEAVRLKPDDANILDSRGFVFLRLGRLDRAIGDYTAALKIEPKLAGSLYGRGLARIGRGDRAGGAEDVTAARAIDPGIQDTFARYGIR